MSNTPCGGKWPYKEGAVRLGCSLHWTKIWLSVVSPPFIMSHPVPQRLRQTDGKDQSNQEHKGLIGLVKPSLVGGMTNIQCKAIITGVISCLYKVRQSSGDSNEDVWLWIDRLWVLSSVPSCQSKLSLFLVCHMGWQSSWKHHQLSLKKLSTLNLYHFFHLACTIFAGGHKQYLT